MIKSDRRVQCGVVVLIDGSLGLCSNSSKIQDFNLQMLFMVDCGNLDASKANYELDRAECTIASIINTCTAPFCSYANVPVDHNAAPPPHSTLAQEVDTSTIKTNSFNFWRTYPRCCLPHELGDDPEHGVSKPFYTMLKFLQTFSQRTVQCRHHLYTRSHAWITSKSTKEQVLSSRRSKSDLDDRRRLNLGDSRKVNHHFLESSSPSYTDYCLFSYRMQSARRSIRNKYENGHNDHKNTLEDINTDELPLDIQETIAKYRIDSNSIEIAELEKEDKSSKERTKKSPKEHPTKLLSERMSIQSSTGYLLQQRRILNQIFAEFADQCSPFKIEVSKPHPHSVTISAQNKSNINKLRQYILKHIQSKVLSIKCGDKKAAVIGAGGLNLRMIRDECQLGFLWENDQIPGLMHIYDRNLRNGYNGLNQIQSVMDRTSILPLPIGQYGLLIMDNAYWLDFIREHSNAFIVGLDVKPSELQKRKMQQIESLNVNQSENGNQSEKSGKIADNANQNDVHLMKEIIENTMKSRLLISGDSEEITMNATQMIYEFLKDSEEMSIDKKEFGHILGKYKRTINAIINEVESKFIDDGEYKQHFGEEQIAENDRDDPFWLEGLRLSVFPCDEQYGHCSLWIHGPPFMRSALKYYINSVLLNRRKFLFTHSTSFWIQCLFDYKMECMVIYESLRKLFGVKMKLVHSQKAIKIDDESQEYRRLYDGETYLLMESMSREQKLNIAGLRQFMDDLVANSTKMAVGQYVHLFESSNAMDFWSSMASDCSVSVIFDSKNGQLLIIGLKANVSDFQSRLLKIIKQIKRIQNEEDKSCVFDNDLLQSVWDQIETS